MRDIFETKLARTRTEAEVVTVVRDYVSCWLPDDLGAIPSRCVPGKIRDAEDIADCALALTLANIEATESNGLLSEMESFFAHACSHVSALEGRAHRERQQSSAVD